MKKVIVLLSVLLLFSFAFGAIGWSGNIWPNSGSDQTNGSDITVYYQIWKDGVTNAEGQGANISATLYYKESAEGSYQSLAMTYLGENGSNDEYSAAIPNSYFYTGDVINFYCEGYDASDGTYSYGADQGGSGTLTESSPGSYNIVAGLDQAVTVTFSVYMGSTTGYSGGVSIQGDQSPLNWTEGSMLLTDPDEDLIYTVDVEFPAGTNPNLAYKYVKNDGSSWSWENFGEGINRSLTIDDSSPTQSLEIINTYGVKNADYANGWYDDYVTISKNGSGATYYLVGSEVTALDGYDFGAVSTLSLTACDMKYWCNSVDRSGGSVNYKIMSSDGSTEIVAPVSIVWDQAKLEGEGETNDYQGTKSLNVNLLSGLADATSYQLHIWAKSEGVVQGDSYLNNYSEGAAHNYVSTFTTPEGDPLAITLASFVANAVDGTVELAWTTATETENDHFCVYRDGAVIGRVEGNGTCSDPHDYVFVDTKVLPGVHEYAIADVDLSGTEKMHEAVSVEIGATLAEADFILNKAYPNPFNPLTTIEYCMGRSAHMELGVYNMQGEKVANLYNGLQASGTHTAVWNAEGMSSGIYFVRFIAEDMLQTMKVVLMK